MTERIQRLKAYQWDRRHHEARRELPEGMALPYRDAAMSDVACVALRTQWRSTWRRRTCFPGS